MSKEIQVVLPQMGESIQEATITKWHKKIGEHVEIDEILYEISTDKVDTEIPSPVAGVLSKIIVLEGQVGKVNKPVAVISESGAAGEEVTKVREFEKISNTSPKIDEKKENFPQEKVNKESKPMQSSEIERVTVSQNIQVSKEEVLNILQPETNSELKGRIFASPLAKKVAKEKEISLAQVPGSGLNGKITKQDVENYVPAKQIISQNVMPLNQTAKLSSPEASFATSASPTPINLGNMRVEKVPMSSMRKKIAEHMVYSKHTSPHVTSIVEVDVQKLVDLREKYKAKFEKENGFKLSYTPFLLQSAIEGINAVPIVNSSIDGDNILYKKDINLSVAVALDWGLIVPVIKQAQDKSLLGIARSLNDLADRARRKKLLPEDVQDGSFSITNFGTFGTLIGQPIINQPQAAIMGIGVFTKRPVVINDAIAIRTMAYVVLSFDHRIIDGADSGKFLNVVKNYLEKGLPETI